jgi:hypothetical protein
MTSQTSPDLLDLAETVAAGTLRADDAERQVRAALGPEGNAASDRAVRELRDLTRAVGAVRSHVSATREASAAASPDPAQGGAPVATVVPGPVTAGGARRRAPLGRDSRGPRRTWLLVAATVVVGAGVIGASVVGGRLVAPTPAPTNPVAIADASATPEASPAATTVSSPAPSATPIVAQPGPGLFAYVKDDQIWVADADGTGARVLIPPQGGKIGLGNWSADGSRLVFSLAPRVETPGYPTFGPSRLYLTDASGSGPEVVDTQLSTSCGPPNCRGDYDAVFSNDGSRLVFVRGGETTTDLTSTLATVDLSTGRVTELASTTVPGVGHYNSGAPENYHPRWSPDGTQIVFAQELPVTARTGTCPTCTVDPVGVFVVDADGQNLHQVSADCTLLCAPDWSPDGTRIVFGAKSGDNTHQYFDIDTVRPDGTDLRRLTSDRISVLPSWTADGRIAFVKTPMVDGNPLPAQWWTMDADGGNAAQYTVSSLVEELWAGNITHPVWQPTP